MTNTPLNPDAIEHAIKEVYGDGPRMDWPSDMTGYQTHRDYARTIVEQIASAYLAVAQPVVNSVEELDKLPLMTILCDFHGYRAEKWTHGFKLVGSVGVYSITLPARVLYRPTEESTNGR